MKSADTTSPSRVLFERHFELDARRSDYVETPARHTLHLRQRSADNLKRRLHELTRSGTFIWYSGDTRKTGRGSLMVYAIAADENEAMYAEIVRRDDGWRLTKPLRSVDDVVQNTGASSQPRGSKASARRRPPAS